MPLGLSFIHNFRGIRVLDVQGKASCTVFALQLYVRYIRFSTFFHVLLASAILASTPQNLGLNGRNASLYT
jgi:hypothetical protein